MKIIKKLIRFKHNFLNQHQMKLFLMMKMIIIYNNMMLGVVMFQENQQKKKINKN